MKILAMAMVLLMIVPQTVAAQGEVMLTEHLHPGYAVVAIVEADTNVYRDRRRLSKVIGEFSAGEAVEILRDYSAKWYLVQSHETLLTGWVEGRVLVIPPDEPAQTNQLTAVQLEEFVNTTGFESATAFLVYTDLLRQRVHVFTGEAGEWRLLETFVCASGKNDTPTTRGQFEVSERGSWFYSKRLGSGGKFWVRFNDTYLFHSVAMNNAKEVIDPTLGERVSSGCIRLSVEDAQWIYTNIPEQTAVIVN